ncbi:MAG TPA: hypothetical protein VGJ15_01690, partial [Pirellulales bacterium]
MNIEKPDKSDDIVPAAAKPRCRWLRFSLRTFFVLLTIFGVWLGIKINAARRQHEAVTAIARAGGHVIYDCQLKPIATSSTVSRLSSGMQWRDSSIGSDNTPPAPQWLRSIFGDDFFRTAVAVYFTDPKAQREIFDFQLLGNLPALMVLDIDGTSMQTPIDDAALGSLAKLDRLQFLSLPNTQINGLVLAALPNPQAIVYLRLWGTRIDDRAMKHI